jgi:protein SCO1/2
MKAWLLIVVCALVGACGDSREVRGLVLKVTPPSSVTVSHEPVPGYMDAMVMQVTAARATELRDVHPGDRIQFRMTVGRQTTIDRIRILSAAPPSAPEAPGAVAALAIGDAVPPFTLIDQHGTSVSLDSLRGKVVVVSFIYTRCPLPDYCPRVMTNLASLRDRYASRLGTELVLLAVTFDPQFDTSEKLREYAARYGANVPGWQLLTGSRAETTRVCTLLGVDFYPEEGMLTHTVQTAIIDRAGRLAARAEGRDFSTRQLADLVEIQLAVEIH